MSAIDFDDISVTFTNCRFDSIKQSEEIADIARRSAYSKGGSNLAGILPNSTQQQLVENNKTIASNKRKLNLEEK